MTSRRAAGQQRGVKKLNLNRFSVLLPATGHDGRPRKRALLAAADASSEEQNAFLFEVRDASIGVVPVAAGGSARHTIGGSARQTRQGSSR